MDNPFDYYKDKVKYDYVLKGKMKYSYDGGVERQQIDASFEIEKQIEELLKDEDYNKIIFDDVELGRVYPRLDEMAEYIEITFGISLIDNEEKPTLQDLKEHVEEYMHVLDSNLNGVSVMGWYNEEEEVEPTLVWLKGSKDIQVEVIDQPKEEKEESININTIDKKLVTEEKLSFKLNESIKELVLDDDGNIQKLENGKVIESCPFSKKTVINMTQEILNEGYTICEAEVKTSNGETVDTEKEKEEIEQVSQEVDEIAAMKKQLQDKVDSIVEESKEKEEIKTFPESEFTNKILTQEEATYENIDKNLTDEQREFIVNNFDTLDVFVDEYVLSLFKMCCGNDMKMELISLTKLINYLVRREDNK